MDTVPMTPEEVQNFKFRVTVEGVDFDVPVNYHYEEFERFKIWPRPPRAQVEGRARRKVDVIEITALLPDVEPYTEANAAEFGVRGFGKEVSATLFKRRSGLASWQYYFDYAGKQLVRLPESPEIPDMVHYREAYQGTVSDHRDIYLSHDHPEEDLIRIICRNKKEEGDFPYCKVETLYSDRFNLNLTFGREYLGQWREIERKVKRVFDDFREAARN